MKIIHAQKNENSVWCGINIFMPDLDFRGDGWNNINCMPCLLAARHHPFVANPKEIAARIAYIESNVLSKDELSQLIKKLEL